MEYPKVRVKLLPIAKLVVFALKRFNSDVRATGLGFEHYSAVNKGIKSVVLAHTYISTRVVNCTTLALDDVTCFCERATENFNAKSFAF